MTDDARPRVTLHPAAEHGPPKESGEGVSASRPRKFVAHARCAYELSGGVSALLRTIVLRPGNLNGLSQRRDSTALTPGDVPGISRLFLALFARWCVARH